MCEAAECLERLPVCLKSIGKRIIAKIPAPLAADCGGPGHRDARCRQISDAFETSLLGFIEGLEQVHRHPRMAVEHGTAYRDHVHDRKDAGRRVVSRLLV